MAVRDLIVGTHVDFVVLPKSRTGVVSTKTSRFSTAAPRSAAARYIMAVEEDAAQACSRLMTLNGRVGVESTTSIGFPHERIEESLVCRDVVFVERTGGLRIDLRESPLANIAIGT